ncbi:salviol synthase-like [Andrographis paniculata]|uniref:salviol synthase-like n=1 Tax=Andrographis paniculata TaxID=175694 RepID=UPI0021E80281|nr:salviol synthase-like [Andrographis paniculata]
MDSELTSSIILFSSLIFLALLWNVITRSKGARNSSINLPPGPRKLPVIGNLHLLISSRPPHHILADLAKKYGPLMHLQLGEISTVVISSPETAKAVMKTHDINFANRPSLFATKIITYENSDVAFSPYGEYWRQLRKVCTIELLSAKRVQSFRPLREQVLFDMCKWIASKEGSSINLTEKVSLATCDMVLRAALGNTIDEHEAMAFAAKEVLELLGGYYVGDLFPSISLLQAIGGFRGRVKNVHKLSDTILQKIINSRKVAKPQGEQEENLVDILLKFHKDTGHEHQFSDKNIKAVLQDMFMAGIETSSTATDWAMAELMRHPRVLKKAQDELRWVFRDKGFVDESDFDELKYLKLVVKEIFRMHPPGPLLLPRENKESCKINGYTIPGKCNVVVNAWAIGRDPKIWKDADSFIPERFLDNNISVDYTGKSFEFLPFGSGRRSCAGMTFGLTNVEVPLAVLLYHFDWVLPEGMKPEDVDMAERFGVAAGRKKPLFVIPKLRNPLPSSK